MSRTQKVKKESPAKRLKSVYYRLWEKDNEGHEDFQSYYESKMEKLITHFKKMI